MISYYSLAMLYFYRLLFAFRKIQKRLYVKVYNKKKTSR